MKRLFLLMSLIWRQQLKLYSIAAVTGAIIGIFVLAPSYDYISAREPGADPLSSIGYVFSQVKAMLMGKSSHNNFEMIIFYAEIGAMLGLLSLFLYKVLHKRLLHIDHLKMELDKDLPSLSGRAKGLIWSSNRRCVGIWLRRASIGLLKVSF